MNKRHVNVVCAINKKDDKYLSVKRSDKGESRLKVGISWRKNLKRGESMEEAIVREIKEELNC